MKGFFFWILNAACLPLIAQSQPTQMVVDREGKDVSALYEGNYTKKGWWQGLPPISAPENRYQRWLWYRSKPEHAQIVGIPTFVQLRVGAWLGHKFILIAHPDSAQALQALRKKARSWAHFLYQRDSANRETTKSISLEYLPLKSIPDWVYEFKNLRRLTLSGTAIKHIPKRLNELEHLEELFVDNMQHPDSLRVDRIKQVTFLSLKGNRYERAPIWIWQFPRLEELDFSRNRMTHLPNWVIGLRKLKSLKVSENPLNLHRQWLIGLHHIRQLRLNQCGLEYYPKRMFRLRKLTELQLAGNLLSEIPEGISRLKNLTSLSLYRNQISELTSEFYSLKKLQIVDLFYNNIERISPAIGSMDSLKVLYLANNKIFEIPQEIGHLSVLEELYLHHNRLSDIPNSFANLDELRVFHINHNYFSQFPEEILNMSSLSDLDFSYNEIGDVPLSLTQLTSLELLFFQENPVNLENTEGEALKAALDTLEKVGVRIGY